MRDDHELTLSDETIQKLDEAADVALVERGVHLVEHAEGTRLDHVDGEEKGNRRHRSLTAGEQRDALELFAGRLGDDLDPALKRITFVHEKEVGLTTAEELGEHLLEVQTDLLEGLGEELPGGLVDARNRLQKFLLGVHQVGVLLFEESVALLEFVVFLDGVEVHRAHRVDPLGEFGNDGLDPLPRDLRGHRSGSGNDLVSRPLRGSRGFLPLGEGGPALLLLLGEDGLEQGITVRLKSREVELVAAGNMVPDRLGAETQFGEANLVARAVVLKVGEVFAGRPQGDLQSLHTGLQFRPARTQFQDAGLGLADLRAPERNAPGEFGRLGFQGADPLPVGGDVALAGGNGLG